MGGTLHDSRRTDRKTIHRIWAGIRLIPASADRKLSGRVKHEAFIFMLKSDVTINIVTL